MFFIYRFAVTYRTKQNAHFFRPPSVFAHELNHYAFLLSIQKRETEDLGAQANEVRS
jgi:hypothetical protein